MLINPLKYKSEFLLVNLFIINLFISSISNYKLSSFILKSVSTLLLFISLHVVLKKHQIKLPKILSYQNSRVFYVVIFFLILVPGLTILYSVNPSFGILKITYLLISTIPAILFFKIILQAERINWQSVLYISAIAWGIFSVVLILAANPFEYSTAYSFTPGRWSHVIAGKFLGFLLIIIIIYALFQKTGKELIISLMAAGLLVIGIYYTGLRAAALGTAIIIPFLLFYSFTKMKSGRRNIYKILAVLISSAALVILINPNEQALSRRYDYMNRQDDPSFKAREEAVNLSWQMFLEAPLIGKGFGGFNTYYKNDLPLLMKYPHNILLEILAELGITGLVFYSVIFFFMFRAISRVSPYLCFIFIFAFWLALFSKDLSTQTLLFLGLSFLPFSKGETQRG